MSNHQINIARKQDVERRIQELSRRSSDIKSRLAPALKSLWNPERSLACIENLDCFTDLKHRFPNFKEVITLFEANAKGLAKNKQPLACGPILLAGDPGLGKTYFVSELAQAIGIPFYELSLANLTASFVISGGNLQWGEGTVGFIAKSLATSSVANPILLLDELDKTPSNDRFTPINPFYSLLERHTACRFRDEALEIELDASHIIWFATANYPEDIPPPILSRMKVFTIKNPDQNEMMRVINSIYQNLRSSTSYGNLLDAGLQEEVINCLQSHSPRDVRKMLEDAMLSALMHDRNWLTVADITLVKRQEAYHVGFL